MTLTRTALEGLARRVAEAGLVAATPADLNVLAETAEVIGLNPVLAEVLVDPSEPIVARERAFSRIACAVSGQVRSGVALAA
ncbi:MAG: hypothetical protein RL347_1992 [Actinomycetota bacterium]|jgi:hypothetical protein